MLIRAISLQAPMQSQSGRYRSPTRFAIRISGFSRPVRVRNDPDDYLTELLIELVRMLAKVAAAAAIAAANRFAIIEPGSGAQRMSRTAGGGLRRVRIGVEENPAEAGFP